MPHRAVYVRRAWNWWSMCLFLRSIRRYCLAVGGNSFQKMGLVKPYKTDNKAIGRAGVTGKEEDKMVFKVPTLRNIDMIYPYDGSTYSLAEAVKIMGEVQLASGSKEMKWPLSLRS